MKALELLPDAVAEKALHRFLHYASDVLVHGFRTVTVAYPDPYPLDPIVHEKSFHRRNIHITAWETERNCMTKILSQLPNKQTNYTITTEILFCVQS